MAAKKIRLKFNVRRIAGFTGNQLKMIAFLFMLCDHIGYVLIENGVLYGQNPVYWSMAIATPEGARWYFAARILRAIGRLSFPIFAYMIIEGAVHTQNAAKYLTRIFVFALISEVPFDLAIKGEVYYPEYQNVLFTLFLGALAVVLMLKFKDKGLILKLVITAVLCAAAYFVRSDYGAVGVLMTAAMFIVREDRNAVLITGALIAAAESIDYMGAAALAFIFIYFYNGKKGDIPMKYFFYIGYPAHLLLFWAMVYLANR